MLLKLELSISRNNKLSLRSVILSVTMSRFKCHTYFLLYFIEQIELNSLIAKKKLAKMMVYLRHPEVNSHIKTE